MSTKTRRHDHPDHPSNVAAREGPAERTAHAGEEVRAQERSRLIQIRAYGLWEEAGRPDGDAARERFWCEAESEILASRATDE